MTSGTRTPRTIPDRPGLFSMPDQVVSPAGKRVVLLIAILAGFITPFDGSAVNIALPVIGAEFHMDAIALTWVSTAYLLASAIFLVPFGKIADIYGRKKVFLIGIVIFAAASFIMTLVASSGMLIMVRVLQGIGNSMIFGTAVAILTSVFPPGERGKVLGIYITAVYIGLSTGPFLGGLLTEHFGWRSIFYINVPIGILAIILVHWKLKGEWADSRGEPLDIGGSVIYAVSIVAVMLGFTTLPDRTGVMLIVTGVVCAVLFLNYEHRRAFPGTGNETVHKEQGIRIFQPCRPYQLQCNLRGLFFAEPVPPVFQGFFSRVRRLCPRSSPADAGCHIPVLRKTVRPYRSRCDRIGWHGAVCSRAFPPYFHQ